MSDVKQLKIEEFDLVSFVMQIQSAILQGYEVTDKSEEAPMCIGHCYHVIMREKEKTVTQEVEDILTTEHTTIGKLVLEASLDTTKLQEQLKAGGEIEQMLADNLVVDETTTANDFLMVSDDIEEELSSGIVDEKLHETFIDIEKDADKWDNKELGADEAYVETIEPPKEPTLDESLPKEEQLLQTKQVTIAATTTPKRGKK